ncbi:MAG: 1-deoxy-D-xylulose-5-phosphate reductoisomerase, partial [Desulfomonilia bacterium]|nr:1-deoxy-D-xylulose-5-phosphate reductoisomerase [Desulfomonilia bacterium]
SLLLQQAQEFGVTDLALTGMTPPDVPGFRIRSGQSSPSDLLNTCEPDIVINAIAGAAGFLPSLTAVRLGARLALANKESLVIGGAFLTREAKKHTARIIPVDSEHSAIFQCLAGEKNNPIRRIILTASGGPFRNRPRDTFGSITPEEALNHPTWSMGRRITIDSATMMNKGLEIIEAFWLFMLPLDRIEVTIHPQSIVHSMVEFEDMSIKAQMGIPDMRVAIGYALAWPERIPLAIEPLSFDTPGRLEFFPPDESTFPALRIARYAMEKPGTWPCIMNAADEVAIDAFLSGRIRFDEISLLVEKTMETLASAQVSTPEDLIALDRESRMIAESLVL